MRSLSPLLLAAALLASAAPAVAEPLKVCPEGRLADGRCVNPTMAALARQQTICFTQFKLSYVSCPGILPASDVRYRFPYSVVTERQREINILYERQGYQNVFGVTRVTAPVVTAPVVTTLPRTTTTTITTAR